MLQVLRRQQLLSRQLLQDLVSSLSLSLSLSPSLSLSLSCEGDKISVPSLDIIIISPNGHTHHARLRIRRRATMMTRLKKNFSIVSETTTKAAAVSSKDVLSVCPFSPKSQRDLLFLRRRAEGWEQRGQKMNELHRVRPKGGERELQFGPCLHWNKDRLSDE